MVRHTSVLFETLSNNCVGFSKQMVALLNEDNIEYSSFNILSDEEVRQGSTFIALSNSIVS